MFFIVQTSQIHYSSKMRKKRKNYQLSLQSGKKYIIHFHGSIQAILVSSSFIRGNGGLAESSLDKDPGSTTEAGVNLKSHNNKKHSDVHDQYGYGGNGK